MLLSEDRLLGETMMHVVPSSFDQSPSSLDILPLSPSFSPPASPFEFDIDLLAPNLEIPRLLSLPPTAKGEERLPEKESLPLPQTITDSSHRVPTWPPAAAALSLDSEEVLSPTMFSPGGCGGSGAHHDRKEATTFPGKMRARDSQYRCPSTSSPHANSPSSPYSPPACRQIRRLSSTDSAKTMASSSSSSSGFLSLQDSLNEYAEIQQKVKLEQEGRRSMVVAMDASSPDAAQESPLLRQVLEDRSKQAGSFLVAQDSPNPVKKEPRTRLDSAEEALFREERIPMAGADHDLVRGVSDDPVISLAIMEQVKRDIKTTSEILSISTDPSNWSSVDLNRWLQWHQQQHNIPSATNSMLGHPDLPLPQLLTENDFARLFPEGGDDMHAQFEIWKTVASSGTVHDIPPTTTTSTASSVAQQQQQPQQQQSFESPKAEEIDFSLVLEMLDSQKRSHPPVEQQGRVAAATFPADQSYHSLAVSQAKYEPRQQQPLKSFTSPLESKVPTRLPPSYDESVSGRLSSPAVTSPSAFPLGSLTISPVPTGRMGDSSPAPVTTLSSVPPPPAYPSDSVGIVKDEHSVKEECDDIDEADFLDEVSQPSQSNAGAFDVEISKSSTNIHLWQFIKELLLQPEAHSGAIHWVDRSRGIFKIVDSVRVATLWGKRKNRPAMNYDKLSRSLRQYYKKGIMKKTERTQRLVYQFCHPYHL